MHPQMRMNMVSKSMTGEEEKKRHSVDIEERERVPLTATIVRDAHCRSTDAFTSH